MEPAFDSARNHLPDGRFAPGNAASRGRGNPHVRRMRELQAAVREAVSPDMLRAILHKLAEMALAGDALAARTLLERVGGRPREEPVTIELDLPPVTDGATAAAALGRVVEAVAAGEVDVETGRRLAALVQQAAEAHALRELEERVAEIEGFNR